VVFADEGDFCAVDGEVVRFLVSSNLKGRRKVFYFFDSEK
jgi:hypothetical protein